MSVRRQRRRDPQTGNVSEFWIVDLIVRTPDGRRTRVRKVPSIQTKRGAEQYERELLAELLNHGPRAKEVRTDTRLRAKVQSPARSGDFLGPDHAAPPPDRGQPARSPTVNAFAEDFISKYAEANNKPSEVQGKRMIISLHLVPAMGSLRLDQVGAQMIEEYKAAKLKSGLSPKTVNNHLIVLRRMLGVAMEWGLLDRVPVVRWLKVPEPEFDFLTFEEADRLLAAAEGEWRTMILLALKTGLRQGELLALRWNDVDIVAGRVVVRRSVTRGIVGTPKGGRSREIALSPETVRALKAHRHLRGELVFCTGEGRMLTKNECRRPLAGACRRAGLRQVGWHMLRHTFASHLAMRGAPIKAVQELLGHASIEMTMRYAHLSPDTRRDAVALLDVGPNRTAGVESQRAAGLAGAGTEDATSSDHRADRPNPTAPASRP